MKVFTCEYMDYGGEWKVYKIVDSEEKARDWTYNDPRKWGDIRTYEEYDVE